MIELMLDSANKEDLLRYRELVTISGVTTNPTLICKEEGTFTEQINELLALLNEQDKFFIQVIAEDYEGMIAEAKWIIKQRPKNIYVKIPVTEDGMKAIGKCKELNIPTLATAVFSAEQGFIAALNGADYVAPYVNRMDDLGNGIQETIDLINIINNYQLKTKVIAASFKNLRQVHELLKAGVPALTLPADILEKLIMHPATTKAVADFNEQWESKFSRSHLI